jgi:uncharacterized protein YyaL (SSP411 family)
VGGEELTLRNYAQIGLCVSVLAACGKDQEQAPVSAKPPNRLAREKSPYLLQHKDNPVDWYPWGEEAFAAAKAADKPVFLSIGYSTCHWCHVMAHESFENDSIAAIMNDLFINIKVDREERPDVDHLYMKAVQALSDGQGGWPLSVFLTPDLLPYFGGTYFPPQDRYGRPGFPVVLRRMAEVYRLKKDDIAQVTSSVVQLLNQRAEASLAAPPESVLTLGFRQNLGAFDRTWGGFGGAPKFPRSMALSFLMRYYRAQESPEALQMVTLTLDRMAQGGMYDHLGGGFHRYSTDARWLVPHFEKMLYDNALLARTYLEAYQLTDEVRYANTAREIFAYLNRDLLDSGGAFYAAEDADSEGEEGVFYVWSRSEIESLLGPEADLFCDYYQVSDSGNFEGRNILWAPLELSTWAAKRGLNAETARSQLSSQREVLLSARSRRIRPHLDRKILCAWNGLALGAFALGYQVLGDERYLVRARAVADFILERMWDGTTLKARWADGEVRYHAYLDDYAFTCWGLFDLYEATFDVRFLKAGFTLMDAAEREFATPQGGYFFSPQDHAELLARPEEVYDGALPSGNSVMVLNLLKRAEYTGEGAFRERAVAALKAYRTEIETHPAGFPQWLCALDFLYGQPREIVVAGKVGALDPLLGVIRGEFLPNKVVLHTETGQDELAGLAPVAAGKIAEKGAPTVYVCRNFSCLRPTGNARELLEQLQGKPAE